MAEKNSLFADPGTDDSHTRTPAAAPVEAPELVFGSAEEFLHEQLLPTCVHPKAVSRVEALWRAWITGPCG